MIIGYLLSEASDPKADGAMVVSIGPDELSCQAELVCFFCKHRDIKGKIIGWYAVDRSHTKETWFAELPEDIQKALPMARAGIEARGFEAFHKGQVEVAEESSMVSIIGRPKIIDQFKHRIGAQTSVAKIGGKKGMKEVIKKMGPSLEEALANPLHAGVHPDFPASVQEEIWVQDAVGSLRAMGAERWIRTMLKTLRTFFGGRPMEIVPNKTDRCPCKSGKKYGKCCGAGVQESDPEDCKLGRHTYGGWTPGLAGRYFHGCEKCFKIEDAPYAEEVSLKGGEKIVLIGCSTCSKAPTPEDAQEVLEKWKSWYLCSLCGKPFKIGKAICAHIVKPDGLHSVHWDFVTIFEEQESRDCAYKNSEGEDEVVLTHEDCWKKAFLHLPKSGQATAVMSKDGFAIKLNPRAKPSVS